MNFEYNIVSISVVLWHSLSFWIILLEGKSQCVEGKGFLKVFVKMDDSDHCTRKQLSSPLFALLIWNDLVLFA